MRPRVLRDQDHLQDFIGTKVHHYDHRNHYTVTYALDEEGSMALLVIYVTKYGMQHVTVHIGIVELGSRHRAVYQRGHEALTTRMNELCYMQHPSSLWLPGVSPPNNQTR